MSTETFTGQSPAVTALAAMLAAFGDLPPVSVGLSRHYPGRLDLSLHNDLAAFEEWRAALGLDLAGVELVADWLTVTGTWGGAEVKLTGHGVTVPATAEPAGVAA
ncbi:hypothetical protein [Streptomyces avicenniae]|uniref:hypothetical protein n=1 Tax=Streptomyces avicenniae TaxID=500153 RepID=UPI00069C4CC8|nr:hypothetical protein [Streptomyces avicenniae]